MRKLFLTALLVLLGLFAAACGGNSNHTPPPSPPSSTQQTDGEHATVPFAVTITGQPGPNPKNTQYAQLGDGIPVMVTNVSKTFQGVADVRVAWLQGALVVGTTKDVTDSLSPGQSQALWIDLPDGAQLADGLQPQLATLWFIDDATGTPVQAQLNK